MGPPQGDQGVPEGSAAAAAVAPGRVVPERVVSARVARATGKSNEGAKPLSRNRLRAERKAMASTDGAKPAAVGAGGTETRCL